MMTKNKGNFLLEEELKFAELFKKKFKKNEEINISEIRTIIYTFSHNLLTKRDKDELFDRIVSKNFELRFKGENK